MTARPATRLPDAPAAHRALRAGLPFGAVMATGAAAQLARLLGIGWAGRALLWLAVAEICFITARGAWRHRAEFGGPLSDWTGLGPPVEHAGVLTVPLGLAVTTSGLAADGSSVATALAWCGLTLTWATLLLFLSRFLAAVAASRPPLRAVNGAWFLAPAVLLGAGIASVACIPHAGSTGGGVLRWAGLLAAVTGLVGYWTLTPLAAARIARHRLDGSQAVLWWIWAGCGGLAAASTAKALGAPDATWNRTLIAVLRPVTVVTWGIAALLLVPIVAGCVRYLAGRPAAAPAFPWPPAFSSAVFALGASGAGTLAGIPALGAVGKVAGGVTLAGWLITAAWNTRTLV